jgi:hypothetical protein
MAKKPFSTLNQYQMIQVSTIANKLFFDYLVAQGMTNTEPEYFAEGWLGAIVGADPIIKEAIWHFFLANLVAYRNNDATQERR